MHIHVTTAADTENIIATYLNAKLANGSVLWLVSGGSNVQLAVDIRAKLDIANALYVGLIDERYGVVGHEDSNWHKLQQAGFDFSNVIELPTLTGLGLKEEGQRFARVLSETFDHVDHVVGLFGMGADGHTSGILPHSSAVDDTQLIHTYQGPDFQRITTTTEAFKYIQTAHLVAFGDTKKSQLEQLVTGNLPIADQPVQSLKQIPEFTIFTDQEITT